MQARQPFDVAVKNKVYIFKDYIKKTSGRLAGNTFSSGHLHWQEVWECCLGLTFLPCFCTLDR